MVVLCIDHQWLCLTFHSIASNYPVKLDHKMMHNFDCLHSSLDALLEQMKLMEGIACLNVAKLLKLKSNQKYDLFVSFSSDYYILP